LVKQCDVVVVVGSPNSSNSNRLREVAANVGVPAYLVNDAGELQPDWFVDKKRVGISAGASAPEVLVQGVIAQLKQMGGTGVIELQGIVENVVFPLPKALIPITVQS
jgi:4-hydroxy-3-methylbut-2-enyl diphosphate reductase